MNFVDAMCNMNSTYYYELCVSVGATPLFIPVIIHTLSKFQFGKTPEV